MQPRSQPEANQSLLKHKALHSFLIVGVAQASLQPLCSHEHPASAFQAARMLQHAWPLHLSERLCLPLLGQLVEHLFTAMFPEVGSSRPTPSGGQQGWFAPRSGREGAVWGLAPHLVGSCLLYVSSLHFLSACVVSRLPHLIQTPMYLGYYIDIPQSMAHSVIFIKP